MGRALTGAALLLAASLHPAVAQDALTLHPGTGLAERRAGFEAARTRGLYPESGLAVTLLPSAPDGAGNGSPAAALAEGRADLALIWSAAARQARAAGLPLVRLAQIAERPSLRLICRRDLGVSGPSDLPGRVVAVWWDGREAALREALAALDRRGDPSAARASAPKSAPSPDAGDTAEPSLGADGTPGGVTLVAQDSGVLQLADARVHCLSAVDQTPFAALAAYGIAPEALVVLALPGAPPEEGLYALAPSLADPARRAAIERFLAASRAGFAPQGGALPDWTPAPIAGDPPGADDGSLLTPVAAPQSGSPPPTSPPAAPTARGASGVGPAAPTAVTSAPADPSSPGAPVLVTAPPAEIDAPPVTNSAPSR